MEIDPEEDDYWAQREEEPEAGNFKWRRPNELNNSEDRYLDFVADLGYEGY